MTLYAARHGGRRYHADALCVGLNSTQLANLVSPDGGVTPIGMREAGRRGLSPCAACKPPPLLTVLDGGRPDDDADDEPDDETEAPGEW